MAACHESTCRVMPTPPRCPCLYSSCPEHAQGAVLSASMVSCDMFLMAMPVKRLSIRSAVGEPSKQKKAQSGLREQGPMRSMSSPSLFCKILYILACISKNYKPGHPVSRQGTIRPIRVDLRPGFRNTCYGLKYDQVCIRIASVCKVTI